MVTGVDLPRVTMLSSTAVELSSHLFYVINVDTDLGYSLERRRLSKCD